MASAPTRPRLATPDDCLRHILRIIPRLDDLLLCLSEVVTNAVLHAVPPIHVLGNVVGSKVRVEVSDGSIAAPLRRTPKNSSPTGRGLILLDHLASAWGVEITGSGKTVWFEISGCTRNMTDELVVVELLRLPLAVLTRAADHNLTLQRELALVHAADESGVAPARLLWLSQHLDQQYAAFNTAPRQTLQKAIEGDETHVDVRYEVPAHAAVAAAELGAALDEVDDYCRNGDLLTLVTPTEALSFRRWLLGEFIAQIQERCESHAMERSTRRHRRGRFDHCAAANTGTITIVDELDLEGAARVRGDFANLLDSGVSHLTVDMASCTFIDSVGISLLLTTRERLAQAGGTVVVTNANGATRRTLETTGVYDILSKST